MCGGERGYSAGSTPCMWLSSIALPPRLPNFPPKAFPTEVSSLHPLRLSPHSQQITLLRACSPIPMLQLPASECSRVLVSLALAVARFVCVVLTPFRQSQVSCCTLQWLTCFPSIPNVCPNVGISHPLQSPPPMVAGSVLLTLFFPLPSSIRLSYP